jgi:hypothetical protein
MLIMVAHATYNLNRASLAAKRHLPRRLKLLISAFIGVFWGLFKHRDGRVWATMGSSRGLPMVQLTGGCFFGL